jgi:preprotein translocase subunit SecG
MPVWMKWTIALLIGMGIVTVGFRYAGWLLTGFFVINCMVLIIVVLLQSGKAADLAGAFGGAGSQTAFGPRGAANVLSKATTWCAIMFMVCALALVLRTDKAVEQGGSVLQKVSQPSKPAPKVPITAPISTPAPGGQPPIAQPPAQVPPAKQSTPAPTAPKKP